MKNIKGICFLLTLVTFLLTGLAIAQESPAPENLTSALEDAVDLLRNAMLNNDMEGIAAARAALERVNQVGDATGWAAYYMGLSSYRMASTTPDTKMQLKYIDQTIEVLEELVKSNDTHAEAAILLSGAYGWKAGLKPMRSMFLGPKANEYAARATALAPDNPRVVMLVAVSKFNTPPMFGGDKDAALEGFIRAAKLFESYVQPSSLSPSWGQDDTYAWIGQAYTDKKNYAAAKEAYHEALSINPNNAWVKQVLLPAVEAHMPSSN